MKLRFQFATFGLAYCIAIMAGSARGEELILKDGETITGTIVGFENGMFRVRTDFGFALVLKDKVAKIDMMSGQAASSAPASVAPPAGAPAKHPESPRKAPLQAEAGHAAPSPKPPAPPPSHPIDSPLPASIVQHVEDNTYYNETFHFAMYNPPEWKTYEAVAKETGSGIAAIGSGDEQNLVIVDRQVWSGAPNLKSDQAEARLRKTYQDYKRLTEDATELDGVPAIRRTFTGVLDGFEWHGVSVHFARGNTVFGIIGLTSSENYGFDVGIFNKIIKSFRFMDRATSQAAGSESVAQ
jgi:hypothetical protein